MSRGTTRLPMSEEAASKLRSLMSVENPAKSDCVMTT
jgi:hypothetical protein